MSAVFRSGETGSIRTTAQNRPTRRTLPFRRAVRNEAAPGNRHAAERLAQNTREPAGPPNRKARQAQRRNIHGQPVEPKRSGCRRATDTTEGPHRSMRPLRCIRPPADYFAARLRSVSSSRIFRSRIALGVTSTYSSSLIYSSASSSEKMTAGAMFIFSSEPLARMLVSFFDLVRLMVMSPSRVLSPTTWPQYISSPGDTKKRPRS